MKRLSDFLIKYSKALMVFILFILYLLFKAIVFVRVFNNEMLLKDFSVLLFDLIFIIILIMLFIKNIKNDWILFKKNYQKLLFTGLKYWLIGFGTMIILNIVAYLISPSLSQNEEANRYILNQLPLSSVFSLLIFAPLLEEIVFRLNIKNITKYSWTYLLISSILFGLFHMSDGIHNYVDLIHLFSYSSVAVAFAFTHLKTKTIFTSIFLHGIHNLLGLLMLFIF